MRISSEHACSSATEARKSRVASSQTESKFADALASATESSATESSESESESESVGHPPELSAATYRLFAAIAIDRGDTTHADLFRARATDAREAGIPLHPSGVLSDTGRWDYDERGAALPETGHFAPGSQQGHRTFIPYNTAEDTEASDCDPAATASVATAATSDVVIDRIAGLERSNRRTRGEIDGAVEALLATLAS